MPLIHPEHDATRQAMLPFRLKCFGRTAGNWMQDRRTFFRQTALTDGLEAVLPYLGVSERPGRVL